MSTAQPAPAKPVFPPSRVAYETLAGTLWFDSQEDLDQWRAEPFWRRMLGFTAYNRRLDAQR